MKKGLNWNFFGKSQKDLTKNEEKKEEVEKEKKNKVENEQEAGNQSRKKLIASRESSRRLKDKWEFSNTPIQKSI